ncbi:MAG: globin [Nitrospirota bacterium]|nr:globin [Nitrospirota bacterium]
MSDLTTITDSFRRCLANHAFYGTFFQRLTRRLPQVGKYFEGADEAMLHAFLRKAITTSLMEAAGSPAAADLLARIQHRHGPVEMDIPPHYFSEWLEALIETVRACDPMLDAHTEETWRTVMGRAVALVTPTSGLPLQRLAP